MSPKCRGMQEDGTRDRSADEGPAPVVALPNVMVQCKDVNTQTTTAMASDGQQGGLP